MAKIFQFLDPERNPRASDIASAQIMRETNAIIITRNLSALLSERDPNLEILDENFREEGWPSLTWAFKGWSDPGTDSSMYVFQVDCIERKAYIGCAKESFSIRRGVITQEPLEIIHSAEVDLVSMPPKSTAQKLLFFVLLVSFIVIVLSM
ncbi:MAG: hypothetical protein AAF244_03865 [Pseudomonadota bacterium]